MILSVQAAVDSVRAAGVRVEVIGATSLAINWTGAITLNPLGPNYATLQNDPQMIIDEMTKYIQKHLH